MKVQTPIRRALYRAVLMIPDKLLLAVGAFLGDLFAGMVFGFGLVLGAVSALGLLRLIAPTFLALAILLPVSDSHAGSVPSSALRYRADLIRTARLAWGLTAPTSTFAAQIHQESLWNPRALSHVGAKGMAQVMPATATWLAEIFPEMGAAAPYNPAWAMRALTNFDRWLWERVSGRDGLERMAFVLSGYNGGLGWVRRDVALARKRDLDPKRWFGHVETVNAGRSKAAWTENRGYPRRILAELEPLYVLAGFGPGVCR